MRKSSFIKRVSRNVTRTMNMRATSALYEGMWGEKRKRARKKKKEDNYSYNW